LILFGTRYFDFVNLSHR